MRSILAIWCIAFSLGVLPIAALGVNHVDSLNTAADEARNDYKDFEAIKFYKQALKHDSTNLHALFHVAYLYSRQGWLNKVREGRVELHRQALSYANRAYEHHPNTFEANFIMAGTIARMSEFEGTKERVHAAWDIKKYSDIAVTLSPENPEVWYMLAWWNFEISKANWFERSMAKMLFGGLPKGASYEEAIKGINNAIDLRPDYVPYRYDLAQFYKYAEDFSKAKAVLQKAMQLQADAPEEGDYLRRCQKMLSELVGNY